MGNHGLLVKTLRREETHRTAPTVAESLVANKKGMAAQLEKQNARFYLYVGAGKGVEVAGC